MGCADRLIADLLDGKRLDQGNLVLSLESVTAQSLVADAFDAMRALAEHGGLTLRSRTSLW